MHVNRISNFCCIRSSARRSVSVSARLGVHIGCHVVGSQQVCRLALVTTKTQRTQCRQRPPSEKTPFIQHLGSDDDVSWKRHKAIVMKLLTSYVPSGSATVCLSHVRTVCTLCIVRVRLCVTTLGYVSDATVGGRRVRMCGAYPFSASAEQELDGPRTR